MEAGVDPESDVIKKQKHIIGHILQQDSMSDFHEGDYRYQTQQLEKLFKSITPVIEDLRRQLPYHLHKDRVEFPSSGDLLPMDATGFSEESYAGGGIVKPRGGGQLARLAEAGKAEAVVPLRNGNIPVTFEDRLDSGIPAAAAAASETKFDISAKDRKAMIDGLANKMMELVIQALEKARNGVLDDLQARG
jgi:hypothetical protein